MLEIKQGSFMFWAITAIGILFLSFAPITVLSPLLIVVFGIAFGLLIIVILAPEDFNFLINIYLIGFFIRIFLS